MFEWITCSGPILVSRIGDWGWTQRTDKASKYSLIRPHKKCWFILTAGRWPWKSESAQECVTTHQPNGLALKMDDAKRVAEAVPSMHTNKLGLMHWRVGRCKGVYGFLSGIFGCYELTLYWSWSVAVKLHGSTFSTDLGVSSNYSCENHEGRRGEGFHMNRNWIWISRS